MTLTVSLSDDVQSLSYQNRKVRDARKEKKYCWNRCLIICGMSKLGFINMQTRDRGGAENFYSSDKNKNKNKKGGKKKEAGRKRAAAFRGKSKRC